ncbi:hypothetical protein DSS3P8_037 [Roseobacter phage DSS3P8]|nr:hypothetical protein DSS3P8_037 [Roseobacter phage DSS3P8]
MEYNDHLQLMLGTTKAHDLSLKEQTREVRTALTNQLRKLLTLLDGVEKRSHS